MSRRIHSLEHLRTRKPCEADWDSMRGNDRVRFCEHCAKSVHDLSTMTRKDALRLVRESEGRLCVRYVTLPGGRVKTLDAPGPLHQISRRASRVAAGAFGAALAVTSSAAAARPPAARNSPETSAHFCARPLFRQDESAGTGATLTGTVADPNGAVVPGVTLVITNESNGDKRSALTDEEGRYHLTGLGAGNYTLTAIHAGFAPTTRANIPLFDGVEQRLDVMLELGGETITVGDVAIVTPQEPIVKAANEGHLKEVKRLLADGADARVRDKGTGTTALDESAARGDLRMARVLLDAGADARARNRDGLTALMYLAGDAPADLVRLLVAAGADVRARDDEGDTPLGHAARDADNPQVLRALVEAGAELDAINEDGKTALILAAESGNAENVRALVEAGADVFVRDEDEKTALSYARENAYEEIVELLRARGAVE